MSLFLRPISMCLPLYNETLSISHVYNDFHNKSRNITLPRIRQQCSESTKYVSNLISDWVTFLKVTVSDIVLQERYGTGPNNWHTEMLEDNSTTGCRCTM